MAQYGAMFSRPLPLSLLAARNPKAKLAMPGDVGVTGDKQLVSIYLPKNRPGKLIPGVVVIRAGAAL